MSAAGRMVVVTLRVTLGFVGRPNWRGAVLVPHDPPSADEFSRTMDPGVGLPDEDLESAVAEDALHWLAVYDELIEMKEGLLRRADELLRWASEETVKEGSFDVRVLQTQAERYRIRRSNWAHRAEELLAAGHTKREPRELGA
ncbi:MAG: hypothetical protein ABR541_05275 [Candidatus Dormibacteria bacterium]